MKKSQLTKEQRKELTNKRKNRKAQRNLKRVWGE